MQIRFQSNFLALALLGSVAITGGGVYLGSSSVKGADPVRSSARWSNPDYVGGTPSLTAGFKNWELCDLGGHIETLPPLFSLPKWGPAALTNASGCSTCGGGASFNGDPKTAGIGFALAPPNDFSSDAGQLPPTPKDHAYVMADTGEVVYTEVDFVIPGKGFDFVWHRTYRSALEFEGWFGYGWTHGAQLYLVEAANGKVSASLGDGRTGELYTPDGSGGYDSPDGFWDQLTKGTRSSGHTPIYYANKTFFTKTEKNGVVWEFDLAINGGKKVFVCTSITDTWSNTFTLEYDNPSDPVCLEKVTDTEGHEATFSYHTDSGTGKKDMITNVTVSSTSIDAAYGNISIDYTYDYTTGMLTQVDKHKTRKADGGTVVRPYTKYEYLSTVDNRDKDLETIKYSSTSASYSFEYETSGKDRCKKVTDADGEIHLYAFDHSDASDAWTKYTDPSNQRRDYVYTDLSTGDRTISEVREYLEDANGAPISGHSDLTITRNCDCGQITGLEYPDGSEELWTYDADGNTTKYTRTSAGSETDLVKKWTYDTFTNYSRMLTTSGWLRHETNPTAKVTYVWDTDGGLESVTLPTVTTGVPSSQTIKYEYEIGTDGVLESLKDPLSNQTTFTYAGLKLTTLKGAGSVPLETLESVVTRDEMGSVTESYGKFGSSSKWTNTVTPDGRMLKSTGPNGQERKWEYDLHGRRIKSIQKLSSSASTTTTYTVSLGGVVTQTKADDGGINAISDYAIEEAEVDRYSEYQDADDVGTRNVWGFGSYGLSWKTQDVDDTGSLTTTLTLTRDSMGRVTKKTLQDDSVIDLKYDGFGRLIETGVPSPSGQSQKTFLTLKSWGATEKTEVKVGSTVYATTTNSFDEANRLYRVEIEDPENLLDDHTTDYERDASGQVTSTVDVRGGEWETQRRADGRTKKAVGPDGNERIYAYDDAARTTATTWRRKDTSNSTYTDYETVTTYSLAGWVEKNKEEGSASGDQTTSFDHDAAGRKTKVTTPLGAEKVFEYDALSRIKKMTVDIDSTTTAVTSHTYSKAGRKETATDANGTVTTWTFDSLGRGVTTKYIVEASPEKSSTQTVTYNADGRVKDVTDEMGVKKTYTYGDGGLLEAIDFDKASSGLSGQDRTLLEYDAVGRLTSAKTQSGSAGSYVDITTVTRSFNGYGQMKSETQNGGLVLNYEYDHGGAVEEITYPVGGPIVGVQYAMDDLGRVETVKRSLASALVEGVTSTAFEVTASFEYEGYLEIQRTQAKYNLDRTQSWTSFQRPNVLRYEKDSSNLLLTGLGNTWNADGYITSRERTHDYDGTHAWGEVYRYDEMGRLSKMWTNTRNPGNFSATDPTGSDQYDDFVEWSLGRVFEREDVKRTPKGGSLITQDYQNNEGYQFTHIGNITANLTWDDNGQLTDWDTTDYSWTALGQLEQADVSGETARGYTYDAFGRRVSTKVGSSETRFLYYGAHMIGAYDVSASKWLWQEIPMNLGEGMLEHIALDTNDLDIDGNTTEYRQYAVHEDWQNTVWALSDTSGAIVEQFVQDDPFGKTHTLNSSGTNIGDFASKVYHVKRMHGGVTEEVTGLYDFRNRWLSPESGSWLSRDPMGQRDSSSLYQFALGNPMVYSDQYGLAVSVGGAGVASAGATALDSGGGGAGRCGTTHPCDDILIGANTAAFNVGVSFGAHGPFRTAFGNLKNAVAGVNENFNNGVGAAGGIVVGIGVTIMTGGASLLVFAGVGLLGGAVGADTMTIIENHDLAVAKANMRGVLDSVKAEVHSQIGSACSDWSSCIQANGGDPAAAAIYEAACNKAVKKSAADGLMQGYNHGD